MNILGNSSGPSRLEGDGGNGIRARQALWQILATTVVGWGAIIVLGVLRQEEAAGVIGVVWTATCGLLALLWKRDRGISDAAAEEAVEESVEESGSS